MSRDHRDWLLLAAATMAFSFGFGIYSGLIPTFAAGHLRLSREDLGILESLREVPGLLTAGIIGLLASIAEPLLAVLALAITAVGIAATGQADDFRQLVACSVFWSVGLHIWLTIQPSLTLNLSPPERHGRSLGMISRYGAVALLAGLAFVALTSKFLNYAVTFAIAGAGITLGCLAAALITRDRGGGLEQRLVFRSRYRLYYLLMLLDGGRRVLVQTFVLLVLVREFSLAREQIAVLMVTTSLLTLAVAPVVGGWVDRLGERYVLSRYYLAVVGIFFIYTQLTTALAFCVVFVLDSVLFTCSVAIPTYARHLVPKEELSPTLAMGLTMNHVAAVSVPVTAGYLWSALGYHTIFWGGLGLAVVSLLGCRALPHRGRGERGARGNGEAT